MLVYNTILADERKKILCNKKVKQDFSGKNRNNTMPVVFYLLYIFKCILIHWDHKNLSRDQSQIILPM